MFCPQCRAEYRPGFSHCADCDVDLVESLSDANQPSEGMSRSTPDLAEASLEKLWSGDDQAACVSICRRLKNANIPYLVREQDRQFLKAQEQEFVILVARSNSQAATQIIDEGKFDFTDSEEDQAIMEIPARDDLPLEEVHGDWNPSGWFPEDATMEVWSGDAMERRSTIELSLKENRINFRSDVQQDGTLKIFVMPEDENQAREIVREIVDGVPPE